MKPPYRIAAAGLSLLVVGGCTSRGGAPSRSPAAGTAAPPTVSIPPAPRETSSPDDAELARLLDEDAIDPERFARRELYTWTTPEQADAIREQEPEHQLLTRSESPTFGPSRFDTAMRTTRAGKIGALLTTEALSMRRFAWVAPWATHAGWPDERYGDVLVRVVLKEDSVVARYRAGARTAWSFQTVAGAPVSEADVLDRPEHLAAILHVVSDATGGVTMREYVLCNESKVERFEFETPAVAERLARDRRLLRLLARRFDAQVDEPPSEPAALRAEVLEAWDGVAASASLRHRFEAALAFVNPKYEPTRKAVRGLVADLAAIRLGDAPFAHEPRFEFGDVEPRLSPSEVRPSGRGRSKWFCTSTFCPR